MSDFSFLDNVAGIHSKQPWFVLGAAQFFTHLTRENPVVSHFYRFDAGHAATPTIAIPDGCIDLLFDCDESAPSAWVCGTTLAARSVQFNPHHHYFGVRFVPGAFPDFLQVSAQELIDQQHPLLEVVHGADTLFEHVVTARTFADQITAVNRFLRDKSARRPALLTTQIVAKICQHKGNIQIQDLERYSGFSARTLQRQFRSDLGLTPKGFSRAIRCQSAIYDIHHRENIIFSDLACDLGFSDQSHFLREFKKLVSTTPLDYQSRVKHQTYHQRLHCY